MYQAYISLQTSIHTVVCDHLTVFNINTPMNVKIYGCRNTAEVLIIPSVYGNSCFHHNKSQQKHLTKTVLQKSHSILCSGQGKPWNKPGSEYGHTAFRRDNAGEHSLSWASRTPPLLLFSSCLQFHTNGYWFKWCGISTAGARLKAQGHNLAFTLTFSHLPSTTNRMVNWIWKLWRGYVREFLML